MHTGYYPGGVFEYAKTFDVPEEWRERTVVLEFEGVYRDAVVFVNGDFVVHEPNGYNAFAAVLDPFLRYGEPNRITVEAKAHKDSRWYSGAGIYRPVHLLVADPVHITLDGLRVTTPDIDAERAVVAVATTVANDTRRTRTTRVSWSITGPDGAPVTASSAPLTVLPGASATARARLVVAGTRRSGAPTTPPCTRCVRCSTPRTEQRSIRMPRPSASVVSNWIRSTACGSTARS